MDSQNKNIIEIEELCFRREDKVIFDGVSINVVRGSVTAIMGPSGCGKTTILRMIGGQLSPESGRVKVNNQCVHDLKRDQLFKMRREIGMLFQSGALFTEMNVFDNVAFPIREHTDLSESMIHDIVLMKLQAVGLRGAHRKMPQELSGGMARRAALARTIALDPKLIMYDEPFAGQDPISMGVLVKLIRLLNDSLGLTSIIVSHDVHETVGIADYVYLIADGKIQGEGKASELMKSESNWVRQFMQGLPDGPVPFHYPAKPYEQDIFGT